MGHFAPNKNIFKFSDNLGRFAPIYMARLSQLRNDPTLMVCVNLNYDFYFNIGVNFPSRRCLSLHTSFSWIATIVGVPFIAVEYNLIYSPYAKTCVSLLLATTGITIILWSHVSSDFQELLSITLAGISLLSIGVISFLYSISWHGLYGAILVATSGLILNQPNGRGWFGLPSVDWFHYIFAVGVYFLKIGMYD